MNQETKKSLAHNYTEENNVDNKKSEHEFIQHINSVYDKCDGYETYGNTVEFFDEDGIVLMLATSTEDSNGINFKFSEDSENFNFKTIEIEEKNVV